MKLKRLILLLSAQLICVFCQSTPEISTASTTLGSGVPVANEATTELTTGIHAPGAGESSVVDAISNQASSSSAAEATSDQEVSSAVDLTSNQVDSPAANATSNQVVSSTANATSNQAVSSAADATSNQAVSSAADATSSVVEATSTQAGAEGLEILLTDDIRNLLKKHNLPLETVMKAFPQINEIGDGSVSLPTSQGEQTNTMDQKEIAIEIEKLSQIVANRKEKQRIMDILFNVTDDDDNDLKHKYEVNERILSVFEASLNNLKSQLPAQARRSSSRTASTNPALNTERVITRNTYAVFKRTLNYLAGLKLQKAKIEWEYMNGRKSLIRARRERRMFDVISWRVRMQLRELIQLYPDLPELYRIEVHDPVVSVSHASNKSMPPTQRRPSTTHLFNRWFFRNQLRPRVNRINFGQRLPRMQSRRFSGGGPLSGTVMEGEVSRVPFGSIVPPMRSGPGRVGRPLLL